MCVTLDCSLARPSYDTGGGGGASSLERAAAKPICVYLGLAKGCCASIAPRRLLRVHGDGTDAR